MRTIHVRSLPACHLAATAVMFAVACGGCNQSPFKLVPVSGSVSLDGQPLAGGIVNFQPIVGGPGANAGPGSTARTGTDGRYTLATIRGEPGAVVGKHRVKIYLHNAEAAEQGANRDPSKWEKLPLHYNYNSNVTFDVPAEGTDKADFLLEAK